MKSVKLFLINEKILIVKRCKLDTDYCYKLL